MIPSIRAGKDKVYHLRAGCVVLVLCMIFIPTWPPAFLVPLAVGVAKEAYDGISGKGTVDVWDAICTGLPGLPLLFI